jgi:basic amino acid/polyamine antiporter, APA family
MTRRYGHLLRVLGIAFGWAVTIGVTIGAGVLRAPGELAQHVGTPLAFFTIWIVGGLYALLGAVSLAELGTMMPRSGGQTVFVKHAFGPFPGFAVAWSDWLSSAASAALITIVLMEALVALMPDVSRFQPFLASAIILAFAAAQWRGVRTSSHVQVATSALKALAFVALIVACFITEAPARSAATFTASAPITLAGIVISLQTMIYTYDGWASVLYFSGEVTEAARDIPRAMISGVISVIVIYLLINAAFLHLIPLDAMAGDPMVADTASQIVFGTAGTAVIRALIAVALLSAINACLLVATRVLYAAGVARVNEGGTPTDSLAITTLVTLILVVTGTFNQVLALASIFFVANYSMSFAAVFKLRRTEPDTPRPFRAWGYPVTTALVLAASLVFLGAVVVADTRTSTVAVALLALSYPVHRFISKRKT